MHFIIPALVTLLFCSTTARAEVDNDSDFPDLTNFQCKDPERKDPDFIDNVYKKMIRFHRHALICCPVGIQNPGPQSAKHLEGYSILRSRLFPNPGGDEDWERPECRTCT